MTASKVIRDERGLLITYVPERDGFWPLKRLAEEGEFTVRRALTFIESDVLGRPEEDLSYEEYIIRLGEAGDGYWHIPGRVFGVEHDLYIGIEW